MEEQIIKREEGLRYLNGGLGSKGDLVLTNNELSFIHKDKKILSIQLEEIISVQATRVGNFNGVVISYKNNGREDRVSIVHYDILAAFVLGKSSHLSQLKEPHFTSWVKAIDDTRLGGHRNLNQHFSIADELKKLNDLLKEGVISQSDFDNQKKKLLI